MAASDSNGSTGSTSKKERYTFFYGIDSPFSQFHPCTFIVDGTEYNCAEQYMMHQKAITFKDEGMATKIMGTKEPKKQKAFGRQVSNFDPQVWTKCCRDVVKKGNLAKFGQNDHLWRAMAGTVGTVLVEAAGRDRLWGIGLGAKNPKALNKATWRGKNWLGYTLTAVRDELLKEKGEPEPDTETNNDTEPTPKETNSNNKRPASGLASKRKSTKHN